MNTVIDPDQFTHELGGWVLRGMLCAGVSFAWALVADFSAPAEIAGMVAGITAWAALFAGLCAWLRQGQCFLRRPLMPLDTEPQGRRLRPRTRAIRLLRRSRLRSAWLPETCDELELGSLCLAPRCSPRKGHDAPE